MNTTSFSHINTILKLLPRPPWVKITDEEAARRLRTCCNERQLKNIRTTVETLSKGGRMFAVQIGPEGLLHFDEARKKVGNSWPSLQTKLTSFNDRVVFWMAATPEGQRFLESRMAD